MKNWYLQMEGLLKINIQVKSMRLDNNLDYELDQREVLIKKYG